MKKEKLLLLHFVVALLLYLFVAPAGANTPSAGEPQTEFFPYAVSKSKDIVLSVASAGIFTIGMVASYSVNEISETQISSLRAEDINSFDRSATRRWSPASSTASYIAVAASGALPWTLVIAQMNNRKIRNGLTLSLMYVQAMGLNVGFTGMIKAAAQRGRPFLYNSDISTAEKLEQNGTQRSFFSQHTSIAFCSAVFLAKAFSDIYPSSNWRYVVWPSSILLASATAVLRYSAGKHFPTDLLAGAAIGSLFGWFIPALHKKQGKAKQRFNVTVYPLSGQTKGVGALIRF